MSERTKPTAYNTDELTDAERVAEVISRIPKQQRAMVTMSTIAFISGMEAQMMLKEPEKSA